MGRKVLQSKQTANSDDVIRNATLSLNDFQRDTQMDLLDRLLGHDSWTTKQLLDIAATLADEQLDRDFDIGHRTLRRTFEHIIWNIECWTDLMRGQDIRTRSEAAESISQLMRRHETAAEELARLARKIVDEQRLDATFVDLYDDPPKKKSLGGTILHIATHSMHHRAQLLFMFRRLGIEDLPEGDVLSWEQIHFKPPVSHD